MKHTDIAERFIHSSNWIVFTNCLHSRITENYSLRVRNNPRNVYTSFLSLTRFPFHTPTRLDERLITRLSVRENEKYEKTIKITALTQFQCLPFDFSRSTEYPMRIFRLCVFLKNFSFQPRVERRKNHFYSFCFLYHVSVHLFWKFPLEAGESEVENTSLACYAADGSLFSSCTCWTRRFYDVVGGVGYKCLFVVLLYTVQQWEVLRIFAAIKVMGSSVRSWSERNFFGANVAKGYFIVTEREFNVMRITGGNFFRSNGVRFNKMLCKRTEKNIFWSRWTLLWLSFTLIEL